MPQPRGNLSEGLHIASILHDKGAGTYVPGTARCSSSCADIVFGGAHRPMRGRSGCINPRSGAAPACSRRHAPPPSTAQYTTSEIIGILNQFETPPFVYEKMFSTGDNHYFPEADKATLNLGAEKDGASSRAGDEIPPSCSRFGATR
ncbi:hypothetical protein [Rhodobacter lacus]|uniref:Uncharacterized protein n=1 Tax=Rhodobacter lacus TaxID=1641972 RepID=A0ABW5A6C3_9RHOB